MIPNSEVSFCVDTILVETVLGDPKFYKTAGILTDLLTKVKDWFSAHIDKEHPVASILKNLAPGAIWVLMQGIGLGKWGFFLGLLTDYFHVDIPKILESMFEKVKELLSSGHPVSSSQVDAATEQVAQQHATDAAQSDDHRVYTSLELLNEAKLIRLALIDYEHQKMRLIKESSDVNDLLGFGGSRARSTNLLVKILGWVVKIAFASAGLMVAGDAIHAFMGTPSALTGTYQEGKTPTDSPSEPAAPSGPVSTQKKFPLKGDAPLSMSWPMANTPSNIEEMLIQFAKDTYSGLDGKESLIRSLPSFQGVKEDIEWFNIHNPGTTAIFIPRRYPSKKSMVDHFIDDVAKASP
jgi:hypothetical protein